LAGKLHFAIGFKTDELWQTQTDNQLNNALQVAFYDRNQNLNCILCATLPTTGEAAARQ
jgi:hypothetical protein